MTDPTTNIEQILFENFQYIKYHPSNEPGVFSANGAWFKLDFTEATQAITKELDKARIDELENVLLAQARWVTRAYIKNRVAQLKEQI